MILNAHRNVELYSCISLESQRFFKRIFYLKQIIVITGGPLRAEGPGQLPPLPPLNPGLTPPDAISKNANGARAFMGNFLCGLERVKRFVKVHLHYMFRNLKKDMRNVDVAPPLKKFLLTPMLLPNCEISRSPWFAKRVVTNLSDVSRRKFYLHSQRPHAFFLTAASQCF